MGEGQKLEKLIINKEEFIEFLLNHVSGYTQELLNTPIGEDQTTLDEFLENKREGSEWTDPKGFKVKINNGVYKFETIN